MCIKIYKDCVHVKWDAFWVYCCHSRDFCMVSIIFENGHIEQKHPYPIPWWCQTSWATIQLVSYFPWCLRNIHIQSRDDVQLVGKLSSWIVMSHDVMFLVVLQHFCTWRGHCWRRNLNWKWPSHTAMGVVTINSCLLHLLLFFFWLHIDWLT